MASVSNVGEIAVPRKRIYVEWKIPNYFSRPQKADVYFVSPPFCFFNAEWFITIYPNGCRNTSTVGWLDLYLNLHRPDSTYPVTFKLGIKYLGKEIYKGPGSSTFDSVNKGHGWLNMYKKCDLFRLMRKEAPGGTLVIYCDANVEASAFANDASSQTALGSISGLCRTFQGLLQSEQKSDAIIEARGRNFQDLLPTKQKSDAALEVCGHVFEVHEDVLESRFPAFSILFNRNKRKMRDRIIKILDCDPVAFQDFLQYVYTGKLEKLSWDNAIHLFKISEKFCALELKQQCAEYMAEELLVDKAYDVLVVADIHNDTKLKECAKKLLTENIVTIKTTDKWKSFINHNPLLAAEILMQFVPDEST